GCPPRRARPSASRRRSEGSTVITAVLRLADAPARPSAAAIVVLPTPPVPSRIGIEPLVSSSFKQQLRFRVTIAGAAKGRIAGQPLSSRGARPVDSEFEGLHTER